MTSIERAAVPASSGVDETFVGREWVFQAIDGWIAKPQGPRFFLLTGEPGSGKSAIAHQLVQVSLGLLPAPEGSGLKEGCLLAVHSCSGTEALSTDARSFARSLSLQLAQAEPRFAAALVRSGDRAINLSVQQNVQVGTNVIGMKIQNMDLSGLSATQAFAAAVLEPLKSMALDDSGPLPSLMVLVDGLDESLTARDTSILDLLSAVAGAPPSLRFLVCSRPESRILAGLRDRTELSLSAGEGDRHSREEVARYVRQRFERDAGLSKRVQSVDKAVKTLAEKAVGNFLYLVLLLEDLAADLLSFDALDDLPTGLQGYYYDGLQRRVHRGGGTWSADYAAVFGPLSVAREPLGRTQLQHLSARPGLAVWASLELFGSFFKAIPRTAIGNEASSKHHEFAYAIFHQSLRDFLSLEYLDLGSMPVLNPFFLDPVDCHRAVVGCYRTADTWDLVDWPQMDSYGLRHLPHHVLGAGLTAQVVQILSGAFLAAKVHRFHDYRAVRVDLMLGLKCAERAGDLAALLRMALVLAGLRVRVGSVDAQGLAPLYALAGAIDRAVDLAEIIQTDWSRNVTLRSIVASLAPIDSEKAEEVAEHADAPESQAESLSLVFKARLRRDGALASHQAFLEKVLAMIHSSSDLSWQSLLLWDLSKELGSLAPERAEELLKQALKLARQEMDPQSRYLALRRVAQSLVDTEAGEACRVYHEALSALEQMGMDEWRAEQFGETAGELAWLDHEAAIDRSRQNLDYFCRVLGLASASVHVAPDDPSRAIELIQEAESCVDFIGLGKAEADHWSAEATKVLFTSRQRIEDVSSGRLTPAHPHPQQISLELHEPASAPTKADPGFRRQIQAALSSDPGYPKLNELVQRCVAAGERAAALELVKAAVRRSARTTKGDWIASAHGVLTGEIATSSLARALELADKGPGRSTARAAIIARLAKTDLAKAIDLWKQADLTNSRDRADALAELFVAAAEAGEIETVCRLLPAILTAPKNEVLSGEECTSPAQALAFLARWKAELKDKYIAYMDLKCNTLSRASGLLASYDLTLASALYEWVLGELWGERKLIGTALAQIGAVDSQRGKTLLNRSLLAIAKVMHGDREEGLAVVARGGAEFAPQDVLSRAGSFKSGYKAWAYAAVARLLTGSDPTRAAALRDEAIEDAQRAPYKWLQADDLLLIAEDCLDWDVATSLRLIDQALDISHAHRGPVLLGEDLAEASRILLLLGDNRRASSLLLEAADCLRSPGADSFELEAIARVCRSSSPDLARTVTPRVVEAVTEQASYSPSHCPMHAWLVLIIPLFLLAAGADSVELAEQLLVEIERAEAIADQVILG